MPPLPPGKRLRSLTIDDKRRSLRGGSLAAQCQELATSHKVRTVTVGNKGLSVQVAVE